MADFWIIEYKKSFSDSTEKNIECSRNQYVAIDVDSVVEIKKSNDADIHTEPRLARFGCWAVDRLRRHQWTWARETHCPDLRRRGIPFGRSAPSTGKHFSQAPWI